MGFMQSREQGITCCAVKFVFYNISSIVSWNGGCSMMRLGEERKKMEKWKMLRRYTDEEDRIWNLLLWIFNIKTKQINRDLVCKPRRLS